MKKLNFIVGLVALWPAAVSSAQVLAPNAAGAAMGYWHTIVKDVDATKKFWVLVGGTPITVDGVDVMKFPGVLIFMQPGTPSPNKGAAVDHPGFNMKDGEQFLGRLKAAGLKVDPIEGRGAESGYIYTPDDLRIEMQGGPADITKRALTGFSGKDLDVTIASDHLHYFLPESAVEEAQTWYGKLLGANPLRENNRGKTPAGDIPGIRLRFGGSRNASVLPTKGKALDLIGFEVKNLEAFCKKLEANGFKLDQPYSKSRHKSFSSAGLTDPWGVSIELTEGLSAF